MQRPTVKLEISEVEDRQDAERRCAVKPMSWPNAAIT